MFVAFVPAPPMAGALAKTVTSPNREVKLVSGLVVVGDKNVEHSLCYVICNGYSVFTLLLDINLSWV